MFNQPANALLAVLPELAIALPGGNTLDIRLYLAAVITFVVLTAGFWLLREVILVRMKAWAQKTHFSFDELLVDTIRGVRPWVYTLVALYVSLQLLVLPDTASLALSGLVLFAVVWQVIEIALQFLHYATNHMLKHDDEKGGVDPNAATAANMITLIGRIALWSLGGLFVLSNLGIEITSLIAGLGIGGVAVALALQGILSDLFAAFSIYFDKPFRIGDFIIVGSDMGVVEKIGIKSTRLRTLQGEELVISNAELTTARVQNFKKMQERRIVSQFGVTYETPQEKLKEIPGMVSRIFADVENARLDRVHFASFGDYALLFEVVYYVTSPDYNTFMDIQQEYNFKLLERFAEVGIDFAYPTQMIYTKTTDVAAHALRG